MEENSTKSEKEEGSKNSRSIRERIGDLFTNLDQWWNIDGLILRSECNDWVKERVRNTWKKVASVFKKKN